MTKQRLFNNMLLFSLFGIAQGFFGILYEGIVYGPRFLDFSMERMLFWKSFFSVISPIFYYAPWVYLATITLVIGYFRTAKEQALLRRRLKLATMFQIASMILTFVIITQIGLKFSFDHLDTYANSIPNKAILFNVLSFSRIVFGAIALASIFKAYIQTQGELSHSG